LLIVSCSFCLSIHSYQRKSAAKSSAFGLAPKTQLSAALFFQQKIKKLPVQLVCKTGQTFRTGSFLQAKLGLKLEIHSLNLKDVENGNAVEITN